VLPSLLPRFLVSVVDIIIVIIIIIISLCFLTLFVFVYFPYVPIPVAARSKAYVCGRKSAEIVGSNPAGSMDVCLL